MPSPEFTAMALSRLAHAQPGEALKNHAPNLTNDDFAYCVKEAPKMAIVNPAARQRMTAQQKMTAVNRAAAESLEHIASELTDQQFARCVRKAPWQALEFAANRLDNQQFTYCLRKHPPAAIHYATNRLSDAQLQRLSHREPRTILKHASHRLKNPTLKRLANNKEKICLDLLSDASQPARVLAFAYEMLRIEPALPAALRARVLEVIARAI